MQNMLPNIRGIIGLLRTCHGKRWISEKECEIILEHLSDTRMKYDALEIGTWNGITATGMALVAKHFNTGKKIYSVDNYIGHPNLDVKPITALSNYYKNRIEKGVCDYCELIIANSEDVVISNDIGFLFIDGGHSYEQVKKDIERHLPNLIDGGIVIFHDYSEAFPAVVRAVDEANLNGHKEGGSLYIATKRS